ncbi:MAG: very short patch repair endonuclease [Candidatus Fluviicola riflensis]|nr:MAG: very short patch repair endonuclease [Candidatus Fluviicola riflensis]OGS78201.1 MAG: very short patch repair endonuclease [Candidatus Fluviicola riflensis]OGS85267.1 MAG: very short patch repair endonuclease [Fluviicola sp. RIFCSPHIGHO2_01_FULL_43_53]OGS87309.1 MAG: very short patch repair endonuclease [Fluviicola sp. RIFCSPHIGHO2_12_FULL_43_24]
MVDVHSSEVRSYNMSRIRGRDTKPEMLVRRFLFSRGLRYKLHDKLLPGKPDLVFPKYKTVVFVHGCFWHGHKGCRYFVIPKTRTEWWVEKIEKNHDKDVENRNKLNKSGWKIIVVWECELKQDSLSRLDEVLLEITDVME